MPRLRGLRLGVFMAQTTQTTAEQSRSSDQILSTKLYVPPVPSDLVDRPRLREKLADGLTRGPVLICAPAGFGKTVTAADWAASSGHPIAWLSLDSADNDPVRFWRHLLASLNPMLSEVAGRLAPLLGPPSPQSFDAVATGLINSLESDGHEVSLVLDDYHYIESDDVHASVTFLLDHRPYNLNLVITSRSDPPLPLPKLRAASRLGEIRAEHLQFTREEVKEFFSSILADAERESVADLLFDRTEGWAAGLQLASLSLRDNHDVAGFAERFSGSHRYVLDYLTDEVLARQPEDTRQFLLETSILDRLSGELCDAITGRGDSQAVLEAIDRSNLFLVPLDENRNWWRYHQLFSDLLRSRLQHEHPSHLVELHLRASKWHELEGSFDAAVHHSVSAGDTERASVLVENEFDALYLTGERGRLKRWLALMHTDTIASRPRLSLVAAFMAMAAGDLTTVDMHLDNVEEVLDSVDSSFSPSTGMAGSLIANPQAAVVSIRAHLAQLRGDPVSAEALAHQALALLGNGETLQESALRALIGKAAWASGRVEQAEGLLAASIIGWLEVGELGLASWAADTLGQVQRACGRLDDALETYTRLLEARYPSGGPSLPAEGAAHVGIAEIAYQRGDLERAAEHIDEAITRSGSLLNAHQLSTALATLAWIRYAEGDDDAAGEAIDEAIRTTPAPAVAGLINAVPVLQGRLLLALEDLESVERWVEERGLIGNDDILYTQQDEYLVLSRLLIARNQPEDALPLIDRLVEAAIAQGRMGDLIEIEVVSALALAAAGREEEALSTLGKALGRAHHEGQVRVFVDEGRPMANLLGQLVAAGRANDDVSLSYLRKLVNSFEDPVGAGTNAIAVPGLVVQLTDREVEVLRLMSAGKRNREIGAELYLAINTVKHHVTHILDKLGATNRTEAVARATELGILP